jgi:hypothetical protein
LIEHLKIDAGGVPTYSASTRAGTCTSITRPARKSCTTWSAIPTS